MISENTTCCSSLCSPDKGQEPSVPVGRNISCLCSCCKVGIMNCLETNRKENSHSKTPLHTQPCLLYPERTWNTWKVWVVQKNFCKVWHSFPVRNRLVTRTLQPAEKYWDITGNFKSPDYTTGPDCVVQHTGQVYGRGGHSIYTLLSGLEKKDKIHYLFHYTNQGLPNKAGTEQGPKWTEVCMQHVLTNRRLLWIQVYTGSKRGWKSTWIKYP